MHCPHQTLLNRVSTQSDPFRLGDRERGGGEMGPFSAHYPPPNVNQSSLETQAPPRTGPPL